MILKDQKYVHFTTKTQECLNSIGYTIQGELPSCYKSFFPMNFC